MTEERLVVIDLQRVFADASSDWATPGFDRAADGVARLLPRYAGRTVWTRFVAPARPEGSWRSYYDRWPFALRPASDPAWRIVPRFAPGDDPVVDAPTFGKWGAELAAALGPAPRRVLLAGVSTDCCVLSTALAAADAGCAVRVAADACAGLSDVDHDRALAAMALYAPLIELTTVDAVLDGTDAG